MKTKPKRWCVWYKFAWALKGVEHWEVIATFEPYMLNSGKERAKQYAMAVDLHHLMLKQIRVLPEGKRPGVEND